MRVTTALTTVMFALLIGMLSAPPADAGKIRKSTTTGTRVTLVANDVADGVTVDLLTVPNNRQFILRGICVSKGSGSNLQSADNGRIFNLIELDCGQGGQKSLPELNANAGGPSFGPGDKVQYKNDLGDGLRDVVVWGDLVRE